MNKTVRLDIRDLPRDPHHCQGQLRTELIKMVNYVRKFPKKADALKVLLAAASKHVDMNMSLDAGEVQAEPTVVEKLELLLAAVPALATKAAVVAKAAEVGLKLNEAQTFVLLKLDLEAKYKEIIKVQEGK